MITFSITIQEDDQGRVEIKAITPAGSATVREQECGFALKQAISQIGQGINKKKMSITEWQKPKFGSPNN